MTDSDLTRNSFLGGALNLWQPARARGYRAGIDPVLLAAACPARAGQRVLELGCGVGTALLCLGKRVPGLTLWGLEMQAELAKLARRNSADAGLAAQVLTGDITAPPAELLDQSFDHVVMNPPFFDRAQGPASPDPGREAGRAQATADLGIWCTLARKRLFPGGTLTMIHRADSLDQILQNLTGFGAIGMQPLASRIGRPARLVLIRASKGRKSATTLYAPVTLHRGARHEADGDDYAPEISAMLRAPLCFPGFTDSGQR